MTHIRHEKRMSIVEQTRQKGSQSNWLLRFSFKKTKKPIKYSGHYFPHKRKTASKCVIIPKKFQVSEIIKNQQSILALLSTHKTASKCVIIAAGQTHTVLFTCRLQNTACRLPKFPRTHSSPALLCVVVAKKQCEQILATIYILDCMNGQ